GAKIVVPTMILLGTDTGVLIGRAGDHCATKLTRCRSVETLEQSVEMRDIPEAGSECDSRNRPLSRIVEQITCAPRNPFVVDVLPNRPSGSSKELVYVALRAMKFSCQCCGGEIGIGAMTINMIHHHH